MKHAARKLFTEDSSFATALVIATTHMYGTEALEWDPATLQAELQDDLDIHILPVNMDKLMAGITIVTTDKFHSSLPDFIDLCNTLSGSPFNPEIFDPADSYEVAWGVVESAILWPNTETKMSPEIPAYIEATLENEGLIGSPKVLEGLVPTYKLNVEPEGFADDPTMYSAVFQTQKDKTKDIDDAVIKNLQLLAEQIDSLKISNEPASAILQRLFRETQ